MNKTLTVAFADDDPDDRDLFCKALSEVDPGIQCRMFEDGKQLMNYLKDPRRALPDYVFLDLRMPRMNGKKCLQEIRASENLKHLPVIIYSTSDDVEDSKNLFESGATHFVTKPINPEEIYFLISMVVSEKWV